MTAFALYGELYFELTDKTNLTLGGRWTTEEKEFFSFTRATGDASGILPPSTWGCGNLTASQQATVDSVAAAWIAAGADAAAMAARRAGLTCSDSDGKEDWSEFTPRVSIDYQFSDDLMTYLSYSRGFRSGGWNGRASTPNGIGPYDPETVDSWELGTRMSLLGDDGDVLYANLTFFHTKYEDKHENEIYAFGAATETVVNNAAQATVLGAEFEMRYILNDNVQLRMALGFLDGEYDEFLEPGDNNDRSSPKVDVSGQREFAFAPDITASVGFDIVQPLGGGGNPDLRWQLLLGGQDGQQFRPAGSAGSRA